MRAVIQRVSRAEITIDHQETREIGQGLVVFLGVMKGDTEAQAEFLAEKAQGLRIFTDENGKMNLSLEDIGGEMLVVSNFTLGADCKKGTRPSFSDAAAPSAAVPLYELFVEECRKLGVSVVKTGEFGADMKVSLVNDGPVTISLDSDRLTQPKN